MPLNKIHIKQIDGLQQQLSKSLSDVLNVGNTASQNILMGTYSFSYSSTGSGLTFFEDETTARMTIDTGGNVGVGTISPSSKLEVSVNTGDGISVVGSTSGYDLLLNTIGSNIIRLESGSNTTYHSYMQNRFDNGYPFRLYVNRGAAGNILEVRNTTISSIQRGQLRILSASSGDAIYLEKDTGIGLDYSTEIPGAGLHVRDSVRFDGLSTGPTAGLVLQSTNSNGDLDWVDVTTIMGGTVSSLNDLTDVTISSATTNDTLRYNGSNWINTSDVTIDAGGNMQVQGSVIVQGDVTINGTTSTINTENLLVEDPLILLASTQSGAPTLDSGLMISRGSGITQSFIWDESADEFAMISTNDSHEVQGNVGIVGYSNLRVEDFVAEGSVTLNNSSSSTGDIIMKSVSYDMLTIDASANRINIGGNNTTGFLDIENKTANGTVIRALNTNASAYTLRMFSSSGVVNSSFRNSGRVDLAQNGATTYMGDQSSNYLLQQTQITTQFSNTALYSGFHSNRDGVGISMRASSANGNSYMDSTGRMLFRTQWNNNSTSGGGTISMTIDSNQNVGIGLATSLTDADARLHVIGPTGSSFKLEDGTQANGYILVSDATGMASWTASSNVVVGDGDGIYDGNGVVPTTTTATITDTLAFGNNLLYLDETESRVGINTSPTYPLHVNADDTDDDIGAYVIMSGTTSALLPSAVYVTNTKTDATIGNYGIYADADGNSSLNVAVVGIGGGSGANLTGVSGAIGVMGQVRLSSTETTSYAGHFLNDSTSATSKYGLHVKLNGTVTDGQNFGVDVDNNAVHTNGNGYGFRAIVDGASSVNYGAYLDARNATNNYALVVPSGGGDVGIGVTTPTEKLHLVGNFRYVDGNEASGYILTSDANGVASWTASIGGSTVSSFTDLSDVSITSATTNDTLRYNGTNWINTSDVTIDSLGTMSVGGDLIVDTNVLYVDSTSNRVGVGISSLLYKMNIKGDGGDILLVENSAGGDILNMYEDGQAVFNSSGIPTADFTIEGDTDTTLFKTNAAQNSIGVGIAGQSLYKLYVDATNETRTAIAVFGSNTATNGVRIIAGTPAADSYGLYAEGKVTGNFAARGVWGNSTSASARDNYGVYGRSGSGSRDNIGVFGYQVFSGGSGINSGVYGADASPSTVVKHGVYGSVAVGTSGVTTTTYALRGLNTTSATGVVNYALHAAVNLASGVTSSTNYAGYFDVTANGTGNVNYGIVVTSGNNSGFGTTTPSEQLHVVGNFRLQDGTEASGYILTSDANGVASWTASSGGSGGASVESDTRTFTAGVTQSIAHTLGSADIIVQCYDNTGSQITPNDITITGATGVNVNFTSNLTNVKTVMLG